MHHFIPAVSVFLYQRRLPPNLVIESFFKRSDNYFCDVANGSSGLSARVTCPRNDTDFLITADKAVRKSIVQDALFE